MPMGDAGARQVLDTIAERSQSSLMTGGGGPLAPQKRRYTDAHHDFYQLGRQ